MLPGQKQKSLAALKRIDGLSTKLEKMIEAEDYCPKILEMALALKGHTEYIQSQVLESHLHTCAEKNLTKGQSKKKERFISELIGVIGLSTR